MEFNQLYQTRIGNIAEDFVKSWLKDKKYKVYWQAGDYSHPFDGIAYIKNKGYLIEVKAKFPGKFGDFSIHQNDLDKYEQHEKEERKKMIIFYVDFINKKLLITYTNHIRSSVRNTWYDPVENKTCIFFNKYKEVDVVDDKTAQEMKRLSNKIINK